MPVYVIALMNFCKHEEPGTVEYRYRLQREGSDELMTDRLTYIFLELPNHRAMDDPAVTRLDRFCYYLRTMASLRARPESSGDELIELLLDSADFTKFTPEERVKYQYDMTTERDRRNQEAFKVNKAREEGRQEGRAEGRAEGHQERNAEIAKSMLADGMSVEKVSQYTGLSADEIKSLQ